MSRPNGMGTNNDPIRRGYLCAVKDCPDQYSSLRLTKSGSFVAYCPTHVRQASELFGQ